jgi:hypothetical protein
MAITGETADGEIRGNHAVYATARSTATGGSAIAIDSSIGQRHDGGTYWIYRGFLSFDTSAIPDGATVSNATLYVKTKDDLSTDNDFDLRVYRYAWEETLTDTGPPDKREANYDGAYGGSATYEGVILDTSAYPGDDQWISLAVAAAGIVKDGDTKYTLVSSRDVSGTAPGGGESEYIDIHTAEAAGEEPYMEINYVVEETTAFQWDLTGGLGQAAPWWDSSYTYRQVIKMTAPGGEAIPANYTALLSYDIAHLVTATKVQADYDDWRVVYWDGSTNSELDRRFIPAATDETWFKIQAEIGAGATSYAYFVYYGNAAATSPPDDFVDIYYWGDACEDNNVTEWSTSLQPSATLTSTASSPLSGTYSILFSGQSGNSFVWDAFTATPSAQDVYIEFQIKIDETVAPLVRVAIRDGATTVCYVDFEADNDIMFRGTDTATNWADATTYKIRLTGDTSADTWDMHIDDVSKISGGSGAAYDTLDSIQVMLNGDSDVRLDNMYLRLVMQAAPTLTAQGEVSHLPETLAFLWALGTTTEVKETQALQWDVWAATIADTQALQWDVRNLAQETQDFTWDLAAFTWDGPEWAIRLPDSAHDVDLPSADHAVRLPDSEHNVTLIESME